MRRLPGSGYPPFVPCDPCRHRQAARQRTRAIVRPLHLAVVSSAVGPVCLSQRPWSAFRRTPVDLPAKLRKHLRVRHKVFFMPVQTAAYGAAHPAAHAQRSRAISTATGCGRNDRAAMRQADAEPGVPPYARPGPPDAVATLACLVEAIRPMRGRVFPAAFQTPRSMAQQPTPALWGSTMALRGSTTTLRGSTMMLRGSTMMLRGSTTTL